ncbi:hypothetical protein SADUNF_Sadunf16G0212800 [Salix dunnii]|uniref:26S proteasome complex subunit SEM1 n=1 Tax=Salix dunnii TaxID=1413687 RepID=A0A835MH46_9ROSI|nr:hypothetical protein SADUNF_Sadunf16G0212800 [Salix dunnii]
MATEPKPATEDVKIDLFEDDDEFEEFEIDEASRIYIDINESFTFEIVLEGDEISCLEWKEKEEEKEVTQQWEDDWDDDDVNDDFSLQLRKELENNTPKN